MTGPGPVESRTDQGTRRVDVELVEDVEAPEVAPVPPPPPLLTRVPRRVRWVVASAVVLAVAATTVTDRLADAAVDARLDGVAGLSVPLDRSLPVAWQLPGTAVLGAIGGTLVVRDSAPDRTLGVDAVTGTVRWERDGPCDVVPVGTRPPPALVQAVRLEDRPDDVLLCVDPAGPRDAAGSDDGRPTRTARVLDPATGDLLRSIDVDGGGSLATVGADLVRVDVAPDNHGEVTRWSLTTGRPRWSHRTPDVLPPSDSWGSYVDDEVVRLDIGPWSLTLDARTGRRVERVPPSPLGTGVTLGPVALPDGLQATSRLDREGGTRTTVAAAGGRVRATFAGLVLSPSVDDGSAPDLVVVTRSGRGDPPALVGVDPADGTTRWTADVPPTQVLVVAGLLVVRDDAGALALDARTGRPRWRSTGGGGATFAEGMVTDGRRLLTVDAGPDGPVLVAREVASGTVAWTRPAPEGTDGLTQLPDGTVVLVGSDELVALRP
ncbi:outer membrane protein assembly factor BamB family protein [Cellulomonas aerilata]|uniref:Pyrrolo-quinoline quinone repeat domain-containing protein n=1 Tax=Cellulomonas aerilata TaxID=515326 RepID=A0A512D9H0_9CELL|nr:PQQ-binding-like beta-propeller repeat protein [Cellulomonas aerilata]GEO33109.1 hypothetical protein CAE01nite_08340 [Cellulomonas aerilata]